MPLDTINAQIIDTYSTLQTAQGIDVNGPINVEQQRAFLRTITTSKPDINTPYIAEIRHIKVQGQTGMINARLYHPAPQNVLPVMIYYHGGGWICGDLDTLDMYCRHLATRTHIAVLSVDYRLAPETPFPGPFEDCYAAKEWTAGHAASLNINPDKIMVGGDSAGGNLAASVALASQERGGAPLHHQLLIYPCITPRPDTPSYDEFATGYGLTRTTMDRYWDLYFGGQDYGHNPYAAPGSSASLHGLPPATLVTAECDVLRDEGEAYAARLSLDGVDVKSLRLDGTFHGFNGMVGLVPQAEISLDFVTTRLKAIL